MIDPFPDTSFLCSLYREDANSKTADHYFSQLKQPISVTRLLLLEFRQSVRFQISLNAKDKSKGYTKSEGEKILTDLDKDLESGTLLPAPIEWVIVYDLADKMSVKYTAKEGHRLIDILHVATASYLQKKEFLTFDINQSKLAKAEGFKVI